MPTTKQTTCLCLTALALAGSASCGDESSPVADAIEIEFRDDYKTTGEKLNTHFLGEDEEYPFDRLPLLAGGVPDVDILEIRSDHCLDTSDQVIHGTFSTSSVMPVLPISTGGVLQTVIFVDTTDPSITCRVEGELWADTFWEVSATIDGDDIDTDLWLREVDVDAHGNTAYAWYVNYSRIDPNAGRPQYRPTCDEDLWDNAADEALRFSAYFVPGLSIDGSASFSLALAPQSAFIACRSGAVGKSISWGYAPWTFGVDTHELATRMVRADYCGNGESHTVEGTEIWVQSIFGPDPAPPDPDDYDGEAVWDSGLGRASCVGEPRLGGGPGFDCAIGDSIPACTSDDFDQPGALSVLFTHVPSEV